MVAADAVWHQLLTLLVSLSPRQIDMTFVSISFQVLEQFDFPNMDFTKRLILSHCAGCTYYNVFLGVTRC